MTADALRRAAAQARALADGASDGPWEMDSNGCCVGAVGRKGDAYWVLGERSGAHPGNLRHAASWDPAVARAAADLLDAGADEIRRRVDRDGEQILQRANPVFHAMTELARTYLREEG